MFQSCPYNSISNNIEVICHCHSSWIFFFVVIQLPSAESCLSSSLLWILPTLSFPLCSKADSKGIPALTSISLKVTEPIKQSNSVKALILRAKLLSKRHYNLVQSMYEQYAYYLDSHKSHIMNFKYRYVYYFKYEDPDK